MSDYPVDRISQMTPLGWAWNGHVGYFAGDVKVWGGISGEVWAQCSECNETYADAETLADLTRWANEHTCTRG